MLKATCTTCRLPSRRVRCLKAAAAVPSTQQHLVRWLTRKAAANQRWSTSAQHDHSVMRTVKLCQRSPLHNEIEELLRLYLDPASLVSAEIAGRIHGWV